MQKNIIAILIYLGLTELSYAAPSDVYGVSAREAAMGGAALLSSPGTYSARGNPALLPWAKKAIGFEGQIQFYQLEDTNISTANSSAPPSGIAVDGYRSSKDEPSLISGLGLTFPLSEKVAFGLTARFPIDSLAKIHAFTENEANYLHFNNRQSRPEIFTGLGLSPVSWLSFGGGLYYSLAARGTVQLGISQTDAESRLLLEVTPEFIPYAGMAIKTQTESGGEFNLGSMYRFEQKAKSRLDINIDFDVVLGTIPFSTSSELVAFYDPAVLGVGASYKKSSYLFSFSYEYSWWSKYHAPIVVLQGKDLNDLNNGQTTLASLKLKDTHSFRLGGEMAQVARLGTTDLALRMGLEYHTSALPDNPVNIAVVDSDRWGLSLGQTLTFSRLKNWIDMPIAVDMTLKGLKLKDQKFHDHVKNVDRTSKSGGEIYSAMMGVRFEL